MMNYPPEGINVMSIKRSINMIVAIVVRVRVVVRIRLSPRVGVCI